MDVTKDALAVFAYHMSTSNSGTVRLQLEYEVVNNGDPTNPGSPTTLSQTLDPSDTAETKEETSFTIPASALSATTESIRMTLIRDADDGTNDTHTGAFRVESVAMRYTASGLGGDATTALFTIEGTAKTLTQSDVGKIFTNKGAAAEVIYVLPSAVSGLHYRFACFGFSGFSGLRVSGSFGGTIQLASNQTITNGSIVATDRGAGTELVALSASEWFGGFVTGTWSVETS